VGEGVAVTPTAAIANDLGERCQLIIGSYGYVLRAMAKGEPALRIKPQSGSNPEAVYIASDNALTMRDYDRFSRVFLNDLSRGFGQTTFDPSDAVSRTRYYDSTAWDIHEPGRCYLAPAITAMPGTLTTPTKAVPLRSVAQNYLYAGYTNNVKYSTDWTAAANVAPTSAGGDVVALEENGTYVFGAVDGLGLNRWVINNPAAGTLFSNTVAATQYDRLLFANRLLYWASTATLYSCSLTAAPPVTASALATLTTGYVIYDICAKTGGTIDSPILMLASNQQRTGVWYWDGVTLHDYLMLPTGFVGARIRHYLGITFVLGYRVSATGVGRACVYYIQNDTLGFLGYLGSRQADGQPAPACDTYPGSFEIQCIDNFVEFMATGTQTEIWRYDVIRGGLSRYLVPSNSTKSGSGFAIHNNQRWVSFRDATNTGLYGPSNKYATTGTLDFSDLNLGQPWATNLWARIELSFAPLLAGQAVAVSYSTDGGTTYTSRPTRASATMTHLPPSARKSATWLISNSTTSTSSPYIRPRVTLTAGTSQTTTPYFYALSVKAVPAEPSGVVIEAWLACPDRQIMPNGQDDWQGASGAERIRNIQDLYETQGLASVIYMRAGTTRAKAPTTISCLVDDYEVLEGSAVGYRPGGGPPIGVEGDVRVVLREVA
jgi:hypothetical protein